MRGDHRTLITHYTTQWEEKVKRKPILYVVIKARPDKKVDVLRNISRMEDVLEYHGLIGEFDIIAKFNCFDLEKDPKRIATRMRNIDGVTHVKVYPVAPP